MVVVRGLFLIAQRALAVSAQGHVATSTCAPPPQFAPSQHVHKPENAQNTPATAHTSSFFGPTAITQRLAFIASNQQHTSHSSQTHAHTRCAAHVRLDCSRCMCSNNTPLPTHTLTPQPPAALPSIQAHHTRPGYTRHTLCTAALCQATHAPHCAKPLHPPLPPAPAMRPPKRRRRWRRRHSRQRSA
jgi:hypothetical protein